VKEAEKKRGQVREEAEQMKGAEKNWEQWTMLFFLCLVMLSNSIYYHYSGDVYDMLARILVSLMNCYKGYLVGHGMSVTYNWCIVCWFGPQMESDCSLLVIFSCKFLSDWPMPKRGATLHTMPMGHRGN
jgi:hypothetical protein